MSGLAGLPKHTLLTATIAGTLLVLLVSLSPVHAFNGGADCIQSMTVRVLGIGIRIQ